MVPGISPCGFGDHLTRPPSTIGIVFVEGFREGQLTLVCFVFLF